MPSTRQRFDVAVVGAGPAGAATAMLLARAGMRVALLEASRFEHPRMGESLPPGTQAALDGLLPQQDFEQLRPTPCHGVRSLWDDADPRERSHLLSPFGCGFHVDRAAFDEALARRAAREGAELRIATRLRACEELRGQWRLTARGPGGENETLDARFVVDATGRRAALARMLGSAHRLLLDRQVGVAALLGCNDADDQGFVLIEAVEDGWWYSGPAGRDRMSAVLFTDADLVRPAALTLASAWRRASERTHETARRIRHRDVHWGPRVVSAVSQRLRRTGRCSPWLAVGDAALAVDPLTGNGVVRALSSAREGAAAALAWLQGGGREALAAFERARDLECTSYLHVRAERYGIQRRFETSPYWSRRRRAASLGLDRAAAPHL